MDVQTHREQMADYVGNGVFSHWGALLDPDIPTTGVVSNSTPEWLYEEIDYHSIADLDYEAHIQEEHDGDYDACDCDYEQGTSLIGDWQQDQDGQWEAVKDGPKGFAAIVNELETQVIWSEWTKRCALCSPCFPGQGDLDSPDKDGFLCYDLPPDMYGDG